MGILPQICLSDKRLLQEQEQAISNDLKMEFQKHYLGRVYREDWKAEVDEYSITFRNYITGKTFSLKVSSGVGHRDAGRTIKPFDVLYCIRADNTQGLSFEGWCDDYGYDADSRKALEIYLTCQKQADDFHKVFPS